MKNAVIYARYSSHNQREESIEGQLRECYEYAAKNEMKVIHEYCDRAISGKTDNRPQFQQLIKDSEKKEFTVVLMYTLDRFARNRYDAAVYKAKLKKNGVRMYYVKQPMPETPEGIILESILEGYAEYYSENLARNVKRGMHESALKCTAFTNVFGYKRTSDLKYEIDPITAPAVKEAFDMYTSRVPKVRIAKWLNEKGFKNTRGDDFNINTVTAMLKDVRYTGTYNHGEVRIENAMPAIVDKDIFDEVQRMISKGVRIRSAGKRKIPCLLSGKLFCGHCKNPMYGDSGTSGNGSLYYYYKCYNRKKGKGCKKLGERQVLLEKAIVECTVNTLLDDENIDRISDKVVELAKTTNSNANLIKSLKANLADVTKKIDNLINAISEGDTVLRPIKERIEELQEEQENLRIQIKEEEAKHAIGITKEFVANWLKSFKDGDIEDREYQAKIIDYLVKAIYVYDREDNKSEIEVYFNTLKDDKLLLEVDKSKSTVYKLSEQLKELLKIRFFLPRPIPLIVKRK